MELKKNQEVIFEDGHKEGYLEARWSERHNAFYSFIENEAGEKVRVFSTNVVEKPARTRRTSKQTDVSNMKRIDVVYETEKAYAVYDGSNGRVGRGCKSYYKFYAKSICVVLDGAVYAPMWA